MQSITRGGRLLRPFVVMLLFALLLMTYWLWPYHPQNFLGDGRIADAGFWSYPRYRITFDPIAIHQSGKHDYEFSGQPTSPLTFSLKLAGDQSDALRRNASTRIDATLTATDGKICAQAGGEIDQWKIAIAGNQVELWHPGLRDIKLSTYKPIILSIAVTCNAPDSTPIMVQPALSGGGNELP